MSNKTLLGLAIITVTAFILVRHCTELRTDPVPVVEPVLANIDSLTTIIKALEWHRIELEKKAALDSSIAARRLSEIKPLQSRVQELARANGILKDTLARLKNCDTLALDCSALSYEVDSLRTELHTAWQSSSDLVNAYDLALQASNERALEETRARKILVMELAKRKEPSRLSIGLHVGYGIGMFGPTPTASVGINYSLIKFKKR